MSCSCSEKHESGRTDFQYAVKIVCGTISPQAKDQPLPAGDYKTKVNVHNPSRCDCVPFRWKVAVGLPHLKIGPVSDFSDATLCADEALEIDYHDIFRRLGTDAQSHVEGWVVIETDSELDVVAVYGTAPEANGKVNAFHTERVTPRCLTVCEDFWLDISTGVSAWEVKVPGAAGSYTTATLTSPVYGWANAQPGTRWVKPGSAGIEDTGDYTYKLEFKLCSGFRNPVLDMYLLADDYIKSVNLNGHQILANQGPGGNYNILPIHCSTTQFFKAGMNTLTIVVYNVKAKAPTGLDVRGSMSASHGLCPGQPYPLLPCPKVCYQVYDAHCTFNPFTGMVQYLSPSLHTPVCQGTQSCDIKFFRRIEQIGLFLTGSIPPGTSIRYRVFMQHLTSSSWSAWTTSGLCGTTGPAWPITAIQIELVNAPVNCHIKYSVWQRNTLAKPIGSVQQSIYYYDGAIAGDAPGSLPYKRIEAITVEIV